MRKDASVYTASRCAPHSTLIVFLSIIRREDFEGEKSDFMYNYREISRFSHCFAIYIYVYIGASINASKAIDKRKDLQPVRIVSYIDSRINAYCGSDGAAT